jgi:hypothetical protein
VFASPEKIMNDFIVTLALHNDGDGTVFNGVRQPT